MQFGMQTLIEANGLEACAAICKRLGLSFIELNMNLPHFQLDSVDVAYFKDIARKYGVSYTIHLDENLNISDFNPYIAEAYMKTVKETVELAKALDIPVLNMHLSRGVYFTLPMKKVYLFSEYKEKYLKTIRDFRTMCETAIGDSDIKICIENCNGYPDFQKESLEILLASPVFGLTFDIGHNHGYGGLDEPYIIDKKDKLCHMHLHDAVGRSNHLPLGSGELDLNKYLTLAREQNCSVVLEVKTLEGLEQSVDWMHQNGWMKTNT